MQIRFVLGLFMSMFILNSCDWSLVSYEQTGVQSENELNDVRRRALSIGERTFIDTSEFETFLDRVRNLSKVEINNLSDSDVTTMGAPLQLLVDHTTRFQKEFVERLDEPAGVFFEAIEAIESDEQAKLALLNIVQSSHNYTQSGIVLSADQIKRVFLDIISTDKDFSICPLLFDITGGGVVLITPSHSGYPMGGLGFANRYCPAGTNFLLFAGTHSNSTVADSRQGNMWSGLPGTVVDGGGYLDRLFYNGLSENTISGFSIVNYREFGVYSGYSNKSENVLIVDMSFENIGDGLSGQDFGAVMFDNSKDITVLRSFFKNVTSAIRYKNSQGPLNVIGNEALNTGRNFFQCGNCTGGGIRINSNSMEYTADYGTVRLEDWINLFESEGLPDDYIQVNYNRARGTVYNHYHVFIDLGDNGGKYMEATYNIGVNPAASGIHTPGGHHIEVSNNKMYSEQWVDPEHPENLGSNVAFSSRNATYFNKDPYQPCSNHAYSSNIANWKNHTGDPMRAYAPPAGEYPDSARCGITNEQILSQTVDDLHMGPEIWYEWEGFPHAGLNAND